MKHLLYFSFSLLLFWSCNSTKKDNKDHLVFRYNEHKNIGSLDPAFAKDNADIWAINQLFNGLVEMNDSQKLYQVLQKNGRFLKMV